ncbi:MAG: permease [Verrucomicrobia bacterium]|nr:MAG: permease [Verrucomicrobiota bacterium]
MNFILTLFREIWLVTVAMAPYLLFGFLMAGILSELISKNFVRRHLGGRSWVQSLKAALVGVPMPICSCGVIPLAASLREQGASRGATASFLASTPQTGVDSLMVTYALLGLPFAIFRAVVAFISGIICGTAVEAVTTKAETQTDSHIESRAESVGGTWFEKLRRMFVYGFISLPKNISKPMVFGIILSGIISAVIPENYFADKMDSFWVAMLLMMVIGTPLYVCSSASVPIALAFITAGIPPGAALVFLIMGPATNAAALTTLWKLIGKKQLAVFMAALAITAMGAGLIMNQFPMQTATSAYACHTDGHTGLLQLAATAFLLLILAYGIIQNYRKN